MAEIGRQCGEARSDVLAGSIPAEQRLKGEGMTQVVVKPMSA